MIRLSAIGVLLLISMLAEAAAWQRSCLGSVCLDDKQLTEKRWIARFGEGEKIQWPNETERVAYCYFMPHYNWWLIASFDKHSASRRPGPVELLVTEAPMCSKSVTSREVIETIATPHRIVLGMSESEVEKRLGRATRIDKVTQQSGDRAWLNDTIFSYKFGERVLHYEKSPDSLEFQNYCFSAGKLKSILFSRSE